MTRPVLWPVVERNLGFTQRQIETMRHEGYWLEGTHWKRLPTGKKQIVYDQDRIEEWMWGLDGKGLHKKR